jgi:hypothetical protein
VNAIAAVEDEVRELVRRRGLDPVADPAAVRRLVDEVITDYDERSVGGTLPQLLDARVAARHVFDAVAGFGPLQKYLDDPTVEEIWIKGRLTARWVGPDNAPRLEEPRGVGRSIPLWLPTRKMCEGGIRGAGNPSGLRGALAAKLRIEQPTGQHLNVTKGKLRHALMIRPGCAVADLARCHRPDDVFPCQSRASHGGPQVDPPGPSCLVVIA